MPFCYYISVKEVTGQKFPQQHAGGDRPCHLATSLYVVGFLLTVVYKERCLHTTITQPLARLVPAATVTPAMLMYVFPELEYRVMCAALLMVLSLKFDSRTYKNFLTFSPVPFSSASNICVLKLCTLIVFTVTVNWYRVYPIGWKTEELEINDSWEGRKIFLVSEHIDWVQG